MSPPLLDAVPGSPTPNGRNESDEMTMTPLLPHRDPTFDEVAKLLRWGIKDWTLMGPTYLDGSQLTIHFDSRLADRLMQLIADEASIGLSRSQRKAVQRGELVHSIKFYPKKETTPTALIAKQVRSEGS